MAELKVNPDARKEEGIYQPTETPRVASLSFGAMSPEEESEVVDLMLRVFYECVAPHYSQEGVSEFAKYMRGYNLAERAESERVVLTAKAGRAVVGALEVRGNSHVALFFVEAIHQRKGIGKELLRMGVNRCRRRKPDIRRITVHSSPGAVAAYENMGFKVAGEERMVNGIRFVPMELPLGFPRNRVRRRQSSLHSLGGGAAASDFCRF